jgi:signal transduction histidine kinase
VNEAVASSRAGRWIAWSVMALALGLLGVNLSLGTLNGSLREDPFFIGLFILGVGGYGTVGALIASRHPRNPIGWMLLVIGLGLMLGPFTEELLTYGLVTSPGSVPATRVVAWIGNLIYVPVLIQIPLVFLLFPTGRVPSRRWRPLVWFIGAAAVIAIVGLILKPGAIASPQAIRIENPTGIEALRGVGGGIIAVGGIGALLGAMAAVVALVLRFRRSSGEVRQQIRWLAYVAAAGALLFIVGFLSEALLGASEEETVIGDVIFFLFFLSLTVGIPAAAAIAILKYRLYDLDIVIKKTVVFAVLAAVITAVYVVVVVGLPAMILGSGSDSFSVLSFAAVAVIALLLNPVRNWARRLADRLVYGKRASPYEVLSEFSERVGGTYSTEDVLPRMTQIIAAGTGARIAEVWLRVGSELRREARWPDQDGVAQSTLPVSGQELPAFPEASQAIAVRHHGELLGAITVAMPASDPLTPSQEKLLEDLASQAGLVLRNVRLIAELRASRQRLVTAQDAERRRIERNIHDGAQQQLVALAVKLRLAEQVAQTESAARTRELMTELQAAAQDSLDTLRDLARGIYPPLLADQGLAAALRGQARRVPVPVSVEADGIGRYPQEVEAAVYFCCLEALQNVTKYASASSVRLSLAHARGGLSFHVEDDGVGFDPSSVGRGSGLQNIADRLESLGGSLEVRSRSGEGCAVSGWIPARPLVPIG